MGNIEDIRAKAWDKAIHAEGTREIFARRRRSLQKLTRVRDWLAFAVPILIGVTAGAEWLQAEPATRNLILWILGGAAALQLLFALWSVIAGWDDDLAYFSRAMRDGHDMREAWRKIGAGDVSDVEQSYNVRLVQQDNIDSHDSNKDVTSKELQIGLRAGLIHFRRSCVCGKIPSKRNPPLFITNECIHCGGN